MIPQWLTKFVEGKIRNAAVRVTRIVTTGRVLEVDGHAGGDYQDQALMLQHYGFRSRPGPGSEAAHMPNGGTNTQRLVVATSAPGVGPNDQVDWEVEVYAKTGQRIRLMADGSLSLTVSSGAAALLRADGSVVVSESDGGSLTLDARRLTVDRDLARDHDLGTGSTPACAPTAALLAVANTSTTAATGTDRLCRVTLTVAGANPATSGMALFDATFARAYTSGAMAQVTLESGDKKFGYTVSNSKITVRAGEDISPGTTLVFVLSSGALAA